MMTLEEISKKIAVANEECTNGAYDFAQTLAFEVLSFLNSYYSNEENNKSEFLSETEFIKNKTNTLLVIARVEFLRGNFSEALKYLLIANQLLENSNLLEIKAKCFNSSGSVYKNLGTYDKALENYKKALIIYYDLNDSKNVVIVTSNIGGVYHSLGSYDKSLEYYNLALSSNDLLSDKLGLANILGSIGNVYYSLGAFDKALDYYSQTLKIQEELGQKLSTAIVTGNIGNVYANLKSYDMALEYYTKALSAHNELGQKTSVAIVTGNIGNVFLEQKDYTKALEFQKNSLKLAKELGDKRLIGHRLSSIGNTLSAMNIKNEAMEYLQEALRLFRFELQTTEGVADTLIAIGVLLSELHFLNEAFEKLNEGLQLAEELGEKSQMYKAHKELAELYEKQEDWKKSHQHFKMFHILEKEVQSEDTFKQSELLEYRRKVEEAEKDRHLKIARFQEQEKLLHNILPVNIADRILKQETFIADYFQSVSVLFMDLVGFTILSSIAPPKQLVYLLDTIFSKADEIVESFGLEKIKTIGDGYLAVANVTKSLENHEFATANAAVKLIETMKEFTVNIPAELGDSNWTKDMKDIEIRIGIHTGEVVAGIIGKNKYTFDLWGDAVNIASRMESSSYPWKIHISKAFAKSIEHFPEFKIIPRGEIDIKGKGTMNTFWLEKAE